MTASLDHSVLPDHLIFKLTNSLGKRCIRPSDYHQAREKTIPLKSESFEFSTSLRSVPAWVAALLILLAIGLQLTIPSLLPWFGDLNVPLLVFIYLVLKYRSVLIGMGIGLPLGWLLDGLTRGPVSVFGIIYTVLGFLIGVISEFLLTGLPLIRAILIILVYLLHEMLQYSIQVFVLNLQPTFEISTWLAQALLHAVIGVLAWMLLDRLLRAE